MEFIDTIFRSSKVFLTVCFFYLKLGFIYLARWYEPSLRDDHALGVGGYSTITGGSGIAHRLARELGKEAAIRQSWQIFNRGEYKTSTEDWLLPADSKRKEKPELLTKLFRDPKYLRADIVIVMLGSYDALLKDPTLTPEDTQRNLELICQALKRTGNESKSIYLCTIPTAGDDLYLTEQQIADNLIRNTLIESYTAK
ncbi:hypothetical protein BGZ76_011356 [Entomortierella beljakovae]|nr:hypothetical protein BGZ76_011356 [Entomortierella beljakovae]